MATAVMAVAVTNPRSSQPKSWQNASSRCCKPCMRPTGCGCNPSLLSCVLTSARCVWLDCSACDGWGERSVQQETKTRLDGCWCLTGCVCVCLQVGLDDVLHPWYREQQVQQAHSTAASCSAAACQAAARTGIPACKRPWVWAAALGLAARPPSTHTGPDATGSRSSGSSHHVYSTQDCRDHGSHEICNAEQEGSAQDAWWQLPSPRDHELLQLLCEAVKKQVCLTAEPYY